MSVNSLKSAMHMHFNRGTENKKWLHTDTLIQNWFNDRQSLLVLLYKLSVMKPTSHTLLAEDTLQAFCEHLVDYVSAGHFEVYERILAASQEGKASLPDNTFIQKILNSTNKALHFNERYEHATDYQNLTNELSDLSEALAYRFELEDKLIDIYLKATGLMDD